LIGIKSESPPSALNKCGYFIGLLFFAAHRRLNSIFFKLFTVFDFFAQLGIIFNQQDATPEHRSEPDGGPGPTLPPLRSITSTVGNRRLI
jgi:hypothetical protein